MNFNKTSAEGAETELKLDLSSLLGFGQVFAGGDDRQLQAELIDANCNKIGTETCMCV